MLILPGIAGRFEKEGLRSPYARMAIALLALIGMFDALYLGLGRLVGGAVYCPTGGGCEAVAASEYSVLFGVLPVAYLGVFWLRIDPCHSDTLAFA